MEAEKQSALVAASEKHSEVMSRKIQELTEKLSSDKHNAVSALEREKYELIRKHEAEKASMLAELKGSLQDNAAERFETINQHAL